MNQVIVVIPIYTENLKPSEKAALDRAKQILGKYNICIMAPEKMKSFLSAQELRVEYWNNEYFRSTHDYSRLLLTKEFYQRFTDYEYMLIYQLDAFVFFDKLKEFCDMGYDYIGSPLPYWEHTWRKIKNKVGNGGLSLRKIESCLRVLEKKDDIFSLYENKIKSPIEEDQFFSICGAEKKLNFHAPNNKIAVSFSADSYCGKKLNNLLKNNLPFGCHAWSKPRSWRFWEPFIKPYISNWDQIVSDEFSQLEFNSDDVNRRKALMRYLAERLCRNIDILSNRKIVEDTLSVSTEYILWGVGKIGKNALVLISFFRRKIKCVIDTNPNIKEFEGLKVLSPQEALRDNKECKIIVSVTKPKYVEEITAYLKSLGLQENKDYILYDDMIESLAKSYWARSVCLWGR